jgi:hypothetical protein
MRSIYSYLLTPFSHDGKMAWGCFEPIWTKCEFTTDLSLPIIINIYSVVSKRSRSQWPRGLRHELSAPAQTLGSWVPIPLEAWISVCVYSVSVLSCVQIAALRRANPPSKKSNRLCKKAKTLKKRPRPNKRTVEPWIDRSF